MSEQYTLKKWYPSLPKNFKVGDKLIRLTGDCEFVSCNEKSPYRCYPSEVENNPEFWEEVVQKDYKILSFKHDNGLIARIGKEIVSDVASTHYIKDIHWSIHSIRRLSDGEVFTVGDEIVSVVTGSKGYKGTIKQFNITDHKYPEVLFEHYGQRLNNIEHVKKSIFTTHDGVDIYEGDELWVPQKSPIKDEYIINGSVVGYLATKAKESYKEFINNGVMFFSTKEKAEEYIDYNKPKYSKKDVERMIRSYNIEIKCEAVLKHLTNTL